MYCKYYCSCRRTIDELPNAVEYVQALDLPILIIIWLGDCDYLFLNFKLIFNSSQTHQVDNIGDGLYFYGFHTMSLTLHDCSLLCVRLLAGLYVTVVSNVSQQVSKLHNYPRNDHSIYITCYYVSR